jgi:heme-degrading monooxygenase HmoA
VSVFELAMVEVLDGHHDEFEDELLRAAATVLPRAGGFIEFTGHGWGVERPSIYVFTIRWETLADHVEGFRNSDLFGEWRAIIGPHFASPPLVEHFALGEHPST